MKKIASTDWRTGFILFNLWLVFCTTVFPYVHDGRLKWSFLNHFNLAGEMNISVWWSGAMLLWSGILAFQHSIRERGTSVAWVLLAFVYSFLSFDEISSFHERVGNLDSGAFILLSIMLACGVSFITACWILWKNTGYKKGILMLMIGTALLVSAAPNEYIEHRVDWPVYLEGPRLGFEEGLEISGMLTILVTIASFYPLPGAKNAIQKLMFDSEKNSGLAKSSLFGFALHIIVSWIVVRYVIVEFRGNPADWYPMALLFWIGISWGWRIFTTQKRDQIVALLLASYFMTLSVGSVYFILPRDNSILQHLWLLANSNVMLSIHLVLLSVVYLWLGGRRTWNALALFLILAAALWAGWLIGNQLFSYVVFGLFALVAVYLFLPMNFLGQRRTYE